MEDGGGDGVGEGGGGEGGADGGGGAGRGEGGGGGVLPGGGSSTVSMTWMTPLLARTSAVVTVASNPPALSRTVTAAPA